MNCNTFQKNINNFILGKLKGDRNIKSFVKHARECEECYEELEVYYTLQIGLDLIDDEKNMSYNMESELENMLDECDEEASVKIAFKTAFLILTTTAKLSSVIVFIVCLIKWID